MTPTLAGLCSSTELFPQQLVFTLIVVCKRRAKRGKPYSWKEEGINPGSGTFVVHRPCTTGP